MPSPKTAYNKIKNMTIANQIDSPPIKSISTVKAPYSNKIVNKIIVIAAKAKL